MDDKTNFRKRQISQWDFAPEGAFRVYRRVRGFADYVTCEFIFYRREDDALVTDDCSAGLKQFLTENETQIH